jgi:hypothetical protein
MAEEEKEVEEPKNKKSGFSEWIYIGLLIIAAVIAVTLYQTGNIQYFLVALAFFVASFIAAFSPKMHDSQKVGIIIILTLLVYLFLFITPQSLKDEIKSYASPVMDLFKSSASTLSCADPKNYAKCQQQLGQFDSAYVSPNAPKIYMSATFQTNYIKENQPIDINADVTAMNQIFDNLRVDAKCLLGEKEITADPSYFILPKRSSEQNTVVTCKGPYQTADKLTLKLNADFKAETTLAVDIGKSTISTGKVISSMKYDSPYKLSVSLGFNQPLTETKEYTMPITLEKQQDFSIQELKSLKVSTKKQTGVAISCEDIPGLEIDSLSRSSLQKFLINPDKDIYSFRCKFIVDEVPESVQRSYIESEAIYSADYEYKTKLNIIKSSAA